MHKKGEKNTSCVKKHKNRTFLFENRTKRKKAFLSLRENFGNICSIMVDNLLIIKRFSHIVPLRFYTDLLEKYGSIL